MPRDGASWRLRLIVLLVFVGSMWLIRLFDAAWVPGGVAGQYGVIPRTSYGLEGIVTAPFIHEDFDHIASNTVPLLILGALILADGLPAFVFVTGLSIVVSGLGEWLFGSTGTHFGASGIVFGFFGYLVFRTAFDRRISSAIITLVVAFFFASSMIYGLIPKEHISWTAHFFGFVGGFLAARFRHPPRQPKVPDVEITATGIRVLTPEESRRKLREM